MLRISEIKLPLDSELNNIEEAAAKTLKLNKSRILKTEIFKQSVDCRKGEVHFVYTVDVTVDGDEDKVLESPMLMRVIYFQLVQFTICQEQRNIIIGRNSTSLESVSMRCLMF